jgi:2-iminobutanoate/2-iminopropanoate deaminase
MSHKHERVVVSAPEAPKALGPYSHAIKAGPFVFTSGQTGLNPVTNSLVEGGVEAETRQVLNNLKVVLEAAGSSLALAVKTSVFLKDMADFARMNAIYAEYFNENPPARTTVQVAALPKNGAVEIEVVALLKED